MNAAEITDKLGLHSLRQRAWVSTNEPPPTASAHPSDNSFSLVHPIHLRHIRRRSLRGSRMVEQLSPQGWPQLDTCFPRPSPPPPSSLPFDTDYSEMPTLNYHHEPGVFRSLSSCSLYTSICVNRRRSHSAKLQATDHPHTAHHAPENQKTKTSIKHGIDTRTVLDERRPAAMNGRLLPLSFFNLNTFSRRPCTRQAMQMDTGQKTKPWGNEWWEGEKKYHGQTDMIKWWTASSAFLLLSIFSWLSFHFFTFHPKPQTTTTCVFLLLSNQSVPVLASSGSFFS